MGAGAYVWNGGGGTPAPAGGGVTAKGALGTYPIMAAVAQGGAEGAAGMSLASLASWGVSIERSSMDTPSENPPGVGLRPALSALSISVVFHLAYLRFSDI
jgi:hypothetical protein